MLHKKDKILLGFDLGIRACLSPTIIIVAGRSFWLSGFAPMAAEAKRTVGLRKFGWRAKLLNS